ncbi:2323_t:CDS:2 [Funneliformis geosporum]|nr:2323_t:CDS:2 [Funneliformis geosporum]
MTLSVPTEILQTIFKYLVEDENVANHLKHKELYNCLFVNKFWCANAVSMLWKNPINKEIHPKLLIPFYISCLNEESKINLREYEIIPEMTKTMFNYASFLKSLEFHSLYYKILFWCNHTSKDGNYLTPKILRNQLIIFRELCKMFISQCQNLRYQIKFTQTWFTDNHLSSYPHLRILSEFIPLKNNNLELFECYTHIPIDIYDDLRKVFTSVDKLKVICSLGEDNEGLSRFIMDLKELKYLKIQGTFMNLPKTTEALRNTLKVTNYSLIKLRIHGDVSIPMEVFKDCKKIKTLKIIEVDSENGPALFKNIAQNCPNLKELNTSVFILSMQMIPEVLLSCHHLTNIRIILNTLDGLLDVSQDLSAIIPRIGMVISSPRLKSFTLALYHLDCNVTVFKEFFKCLRQNNIKNLEFNVFHRTSYKYKRDIREIIRTYIDWGILHVDSAKNWMA